MKSSRAASEPQAQILTKEQLGYILNGACFLGSGGGGPYAVGQQLLKYIGTRPVNLVQPSQVPASSSMAVSAFVGSPDAAANQQLNFAVAAEAYQALAKRANATFQCVLPGEVGAGNSLVPMAVAADLKLPVVDGAGACRAIPGLLMCTYAAAQIPITPMVLASSATQVSAECPNAVADPVVRGIISGGVFQEDAGIAFWKMNATQMQGSVVGGTTSLALKIGQTLAQAIKSGQNPVEAVRKVLPQPNYLLCTGTILSSSETTSGGFDFGTVVIKANDGSKVTLYNQNENLIAFRNNSSEPLAIGPDMLCYLTTSGQPFSNADFGSIPKNQKVALIGVAATPMRKPLIIEQFLKALAGLGYAGSYVPIEKLQPQSTKAAKKKS
jgi:DUF917 family protein